MSTRPADECGAGPSLHGRRSGRGHAAQVKRFPCPAALTAALLFLSPSHASLGLPHLLHCKNLAHSRPVRSRRRELADGVQDEQLPLEPLMTFFAQGRPQLEVAHQKPVRDLPVEAGLVFKAEDGSGDECLQESTAVPASVASRGGLACQRGDFGAVHQVASYYPLHGHGCRTKDVIYTVAISTRSP